MPKLNQEENSSEYENELPSEYDLLRMLKKPKTIADRCREYRARKKATQWAAQNNQLIPNIADVVEAECSVPLTSFVSADHILASNAILEKRHHPEKKVGISGKLIKDSAERAKNYRKRKKVIGSNCYSHKKAYQEFKTRFLDNPFGFACSVCDRLWFKNELNTPDIKDDDLLEILVPEMFKDDMRLCSSCMQCVKKDYIPTLSRFNGFKYPEMPSYLPSLDLISERLISPRIPFMQIRRQRHVHEKFGISGQIINVPNEVNTIVNRLPRYINDDHCINIHIDRKNIYKSSDLMGFINKKNIQIWLQYLMTTPLYRNSRITVDDSFFLDNAVVNEIQKGEISENILIEDILTAQQQTLLWSDEKYLKIALGDRNVPYSSMFDEHAEELCFPSIYLGQIRCFKKGVRVTPNMIATSEVRRSDRRGVIPHHLLYMAMKIMQCRVRDCLTVAFKYMDTNTTHQQVDSEYYINNRIEDTLTYFLRSIPNSIWYWTEREQDLFAIMTQLGQPTIFLTLSASEIRWNDLLRTLYKLKYKGQGISEDQASRMNPIEKSTLVNDDAVTCAIYFNKLVNVLMNILQLKQYGPFGKFHVKHYFKRIEFQPHGSPLAYVLLWLNNAPEDPLGVDYEDAIELIDHLISVSSADASENIKLQTRKHTCASYKKIGTKNPLNCRFETPFMPCRKTVILQPMPKTHQEFSTYAERYKNTRINLENSDYKDIDEFYYENQISSDEDYLNILSAGIVRPQVFLKRQPSEKWNNPFNPFILDILKSYTDIQFITEEYACAAYVAECVNKTNRDISDLQNRIIQLIDENPEFDIVEITDKISIDLLNTAEMTSQEAAWYLLGQPMSTNSMKFIYIPTVWPKDRPQIKKIHKQLHRIGLTYDTTENWKENWFGKYVRRPENFENLTLVQFLAEYTRPPNGKYLKRRCMRVLRYQNYDMTTELNEYKREMVTMHIPFRNEEEEILMDMKYIGIYDKNEVIILQRRRELESSLDVRKIIEICRELPQYELCQYKCHEYKLNDDEIEVSDVVEKRDPESNSFEILYNNENGEIIRDIRFATLNNLSDIVDKKENSIPDQQFTDLMRVANAYITCASINRTLVATNAISTYTVLKFSFSQLMSLSIEVAEQYRSLLLSAQVLIIDEVCIIGPELLVHIDEKLKQITRKFGSIFGGMDIILIGDVEQLPSVRATSIYKQIKLQLPGCTLWRGLKFYELHKFMRLASATFPQLLTKFENSSILQENQLQFIEKSFFTKDEANQPCPNGILVVRDHSDTEYNQIVFKSRQNKVVSIAKDVYIGCCNSERQAILQQKIRKLSVIHADGLPYKITFILNQNYVITTNINVSDGLVIGVVGKLIHIEQNKKSEVVRLWLEFSEFDKKIGEKVRKKFTAYMLRNNINQTTVPIERRISTISLRRKATIAKRNHFPLISVSAIKIHK